MARCGVRLTVLGALGVAVSAYGVYVKTQKMARGNEYTALCDAEAFSCSEVLTSEYSSLLSYWGLVRKHSVLDVSNAHLGVLAYSLFMLYPVVRKVPYHAQFYLAVSIGAAAVMVYLAYILAFVLRDFCLVCVATYVITAALLWNSLALVRAGRRRLQAAESDKYN
ncbi:vitamin K epoxide reductase complex subunit 1 [Phytophthora cinnamomi]|uniref:vitamin K epoxide reductase complex subunit 1 n=1 Tax=Phytophthora cinnamomi TaxID=4785 RepID=UPI0035595364|nr:vitamin K epoxide reductase complex subunit 1 [Phytophthora cinnamomi]